MQHLDRSASLLQQLQALFAGERDGLANAANLSALLFQGLPEVNWVGFYFLRGGQLVLGPFQGKIACVRIDLGRGVCGTAAQRDTTLVVPDVHAFPGHIACDSDSRSEVVVPLRQQERVVGVLDIDSPGLNRFSREDAAMLQDAAELFMRSSDLRGLID